MELTPSYKHTEVSDYPSDWGMSPVESLGDGVTPAVKAGPFGSALTKSQYVTVGFKVYGQEQVIRGDHTYGDYFISTKKFHELESCAVRPGDVLLSLVGTVGRLLEIPEGAQPGVINPRLIRFSLNKKLIDSGFFRHLFESTTIQKRLEQLAQGGTMGVLNAGALRPFRIPLPTIGEQRAIATALSDVDALIAGLERLITKKRDIKQAAMQQLLTGQTRLPGFSGEWETFVVSELEKRGLLKLNRGNVISKKDIDAAPGDYPIYSSSIKNDGEFGRYGHFMFDEELITWSVDGGGDFFYRAKHRFSVTNVCGYMRADATRLNYRYLAAQLQFEHGKKSFDYQSKAHPSVVRAEYVVPIPKLDEQTAIATVLSDIDTDLTALESRLAKTRAIKQGMMQELLTGRTRLV